MGNKASAAKDGRHAGSVNTVNGYPPPSPSGGETKTNRSHSFSCNFFRRQTTRRSDGGRNPAAEFLDYEGQNFEDYYRKNEQLRCQAGQLPYNLKDTPADSLRGREELYGRDQLNDEEVENYTHRGGTGRSLQYSVERQLSQSIEEAVLTASPPPYCLSHEAEGDSIQSSAPATPLYQVDKLCLDPDYPSRKVSSNTAESRSIRSTHSDVLQLPVFGDQVASRLQSQLSTVSRGSGHTESSLPDLELQPPDIRLINGGRQHPVDNYFPLANQKLSNRAQEENKYYYAPVFPKPSSPRNKLFDRKNNYYSILEPGQESHMFNHGYAVSPSQAEQAIQDHFTYLPESPHPPPSPRMIPSSFKNHKEQQQHPAHHPLCQHHGHHHQHHPNHDQDEYVYMSTSSMSSHKSSLSNHDRYHTGAGESHAAPMEPVDSSEASSQDSPQRPSLASSSPQPLLSANLGSQQMREIRATWLLIVEELQGSGLSGWKERLQIHPHLVEHFTRHTGPANHSEADLDVLLENHVRLVLNLIHEVVLHLDELAVVADNLTRVGQRHANLGIPLLHLDMLGPIFCSAVRPILVRLDLWHKDIEAGWMEVFRLVTDQMHHGYELVADQGQRSEPVVSTSQRCCIQATWQTVFQKRTKDLGAQTFIDLFQVEPLVINYFAAFRELDLQNVAHKQALRNHGGRVMDLVRQVVTDLDHPDRWRQRMLDLGREHAQKGIPAKYLDLMGPTFCNAIRPLVMAEGQWTLDIESAWAQLFKLLTYLMKSAYAESSLKAVKDHQQPQGSSSWQSNNSNSGSQELAKTFPSEQHIRLIRISWALLQTETNRIGRETFARLFQSHADIRLYFPAVKKISHSDLLMSK